MVERVLINHIIWLMVIIGWMRGKKKKRNQLRVIGESHISHLGGTVPETSSLSLIPHFHQQVQLHIKQACLSFPSPRHFLVQALSISCLDCYPSSLYLNYSKELRYFNYENIFLLKWNLSAYIYTFHARVLILYFVLPPITIVKYLNLSCSCPSVRTHYPVDLSPFNMLPLKMEHPEWEVDLPILYGKNLVLPLFWTQR